MTKLRLRFTSGLLGLALLANGCQTIGLGGRQPSIGRAVPTAPTPEQQPAKTYQVRRAPITQVVSSVGKVTSANQAPLYFRTSGRVRTINVKAGDPVKKGDVVAELDVGSTAVQAEIAKVILQIAELHASQSANALALAEKSIKVDGPRNLRAAEATLAAAEATLARAIADRERAKSDNLSPTVAVAEAELAAAKLKVLLAESESVDGRKADAERQVAEDEAAVRKAEVALAQAKRGETAERIQIVEMDLARSWAALEAATVDHETVKVRNDAAVQKAKLALERAQRGATPQQIREIEFDLERAKNALWAAQVSRDAVKGRPAASKADIDAAEAQIATATTNLTQAQERLERAKNGYPEDVTLLQKEVANAQAVYDAEVQAADARIKAAQVQVAQLQDRLGLAKKGNSAELLDVLQKDLDAARAAVAASRKNLAEVTDSPAKSLYVKVAQASVTAAQAKVDLARNGGVASANIVEALDRSVDSAKAAVAAARASYELQRDAVKAIEAGTADPTVEQKRIEAQVTLKQIVVARLNLQAIETQIENSRIRAPFDGVISELALNLDDQVTPNQRIGLLADPTAIAVEAEVTSEDAAKIAIGQQALVRLGGIDGTEVPAEVATLPNIPPTVGSSLSNAAKATVRLKLLKDPTVSLGTVANIAITTKTAENSLVIPTGALRRVGGRPLVFVLTPEGRRLESEVETGIVTDSLAEVVRGLSEGQTIIVP